MNKHINFDDCNDTTQLVMDLLETIEEEQKPGRGSRPGKMPNRERDFDWVAQRLHRQYLCDSPLYDADMFRRRYRVSREIYKRVHDVVIGHDDYFKKKHSRREAVSYTHLTLPTILLV